MGLAFVICGNVTTSVHSYVAAECAAFGGILVINFVRLAV